MYILATFGATVSEPYAGKRIETMQVSDRLALRIDVRASACVELGIGMD